SAHAAAGRRTGRGPQAHDRPPRAAQAHPARRSPGLGLSVPPLPAILGEMPPMARRAGAAAPRGRRRGSARAAAPPLPRSAWTRLAACTGAAALLQLDGTLITVALPSVGRGLGVTVASTATVLSAYFIAYALVLLPAGALVDRYGARRLALTGLGVFALGAAAGALVNSFSLLV